MTWMATDKSERISAQARVVTSTWSRSDLASATIVSKREATSSWIQSAPHSAHTRAGTFLTTTTPKSKSAVKVVVPAFFAPPQRVHCEGVWLLVIVCFVS